MTTCGEFLVKQLEAWGVETVFGIPGVHTVELYRGLPGSRIRHVTPRHEQGAGFMADGYARVTGKPGVCFIITGPGMTNILTAMAQAYADSIPMLVISSVNERARLAHGNGYLHELPNQRNLVGNVCAFSHTLMSAEGCRRCSPAPSPCSTASGRGRCTSSCRSTSSPRPPNTWPCAHAPSPAARRRPSRPCARPRRACATRRSHCCCSAAAASRPPPKRVPWPPRWTRRPP